MKILPEMYYGTRKSLNVVSGMDFDLNVETFELAK